MSRNSNRMNENVNHVFEHTLSEMEKGPLITEWDSM